MEYSTYCCSRSACLNFCTEPLGKDTGQQCYVIRSPCRCVLQVNNNENTSWILASISTSGARFTSSGPTSGSQVHCHDLPAGNAKVLQNPHWRHNAQLQCQEFRHASRATEKHMMAWLCGRSETLNVGVHQEMGDSKCSSTFESWRNLATIATAVAAITSIIVPAAVTSITN